MKVNLYRPLRRWRLNAHCIWELFPKRLTPGLRIGWVVAPADILAKLVQTKQGVDLHTSTLDQMIAYQVVQSGDPP